MVHRIEDVCEAADDAWMEVESNCGLGERLTEAILPAAEIAATLRLDWRMALENILMSSRVYADSSAIN